MSTDRHARGRRYGMFALAIATFLLGVTAIFIGFNNLMSLAFAGLMMMVSAYFVKASRADGTSRDIETRPDRSKVQLWISCIVATAALVVSFAFLYRDAIHGYHDVWPVFAFAGSGLVALAVWGFVVAKLWHLF